MPWTVSTADSMATRFTNVGEAWYPDQLLHLVITKYSIEPDERLIRNELLFIIRIMIARLRVGSHSEI